MACESEKKEVKAAKDAYDKIFYHNQTQYFKKTKEANSANKRKIAANTALSKCRSKNASEKLKKELTAKSDSTVTKKTGGFRDEWLEPKCCPEI
tara:strand:+ start:168 stop:449 length:282 start_codon:yes stop_codon:yes gene_type:complete